MGSVKEENIAEKLKIMLRIPWKELQKEVFDGTEQSKILKALQDWAVKI